MWQQDGNKEVKISGTTFKPESKPVSQVLNFPTDPMPKDIAVNRCREFLKKLDSREKAKPGSQGVLTEEEMERLAIQQEEKD